MGRWDGHPSLFPGHLPGPGAAADLLRGASPDTYGYAEGYLFWVVVLGGVPTMVSLTLGHLLRSEGHARQASAG